MSWASLGMELGDGLLTVLASVVLAELAGYGLHRLMHSGRIPALSRAHLIHHLLLYGPRQPMRTAEYRDATAGRAAIYRPVTGRYAGFPEPRRNSKPHRRISRRTMSGGSPST